MPPALRTMRQLLDAYDGVLLDAYGVLVDVSGPLGGARELIATLNRTRQPYAICSNDASRLPATYAARFQRAGLEIPPERIINAGMLLERYFAERGLAGARTAVLGTADSVAFVAAAGGVSVPLREGMELDVLAVCDDDGFDFRQGLDVVTSAVARAAAAGRSVHLVLPNPDVLYPKAPGEIGFTAGGMACMIEAGLARKFPDRELRFDRLGKPSPELLLLARQRVLGDAPVERLLMIGDQVETDIAAARAAAMDSALVDGVSRWRYVDAAAGPDVATPTYLLETVAP